MSFWDYLYSEEHEPLHFSRLANKIRLKPAFLCLSPLMAEDIGMTIIYPHSLPLTIYICTLSFSFVLCAWDLPHAGARAWDLPHAGVRAQHHKRQNGYYYENSYQITLQQPWYTKTGRCVLFQHLQASRLSVYLIEAVLLIITTVITE